MSAMLDAIEALGEDVAREAIDLGLGWPRASVRVLPSTSSPRAIPKRQEIGPPPTPTRTSATGPLGVRGEVPNWSRRPTVRPR